jgi:hypothetical protein
MPLRPHHPFPGYRFHVDSRRTARERSGHLYRSGEAVEDTMEVQELWELRFVAQLEGKQAKRVGNSVGT